MHCNYHQDANSRPLTASYLHFVHFLPLLESIQFSTRLAQVFQEIIKLVCNSSKVLMMLPGEKYAQDDKMATSQNALECNIVHAYRYLYWKHIQGFFWVSDIGVLVELASGILEGGGVLHGWFKNFRSYPGFVYLRQKVVEEQLQISA